VDEVIPEPLGGAHRNPEAAAAAIKEAVIRHVRELNTLSPSKLRSLRYAKLRAMGRFTENTPAVPPAEPHLAASVPVPAG